MEEEAVVVKFVEMPVECCVCSVVEKVVVEKGKDAE